MDVLAVNPNDPRPDRVEAAVRHLREGRIVALPTETFYGLAGDATSLAAMTAINRLKDKPEDSPILLLCDSADAARRLADPVPDVFDTLADLFWPGPLTLVVPAASDVLPEVGGGRGTVGVRVPSLALPRQISARLGAPISGVSANRTGEPPFRTATPVGQLFGDEIALLLDGGPTQGAAPSTVLDVTGDAPLIVREGLIPASSLRPYLPHLSGC